MSFLFTTEALFEVANRAESTLDDGSIEIVGLAGNRAIRTARRRPLDWLQRYYLNVEKKDRHAA